MNSQIHHFSTLPPLSSPDLNRLRSRLERSLLLLARLSAGESLENATELLETEPAPESPVTKEACANAKSSASDRRAFPRRGGNCRVAVVRLSGENQSLTPQQIEWRLHSTSLKGTLADVSLNGAAVLLKDPLPVGETLVLRLFCPRRDRNLDQQAFVVRNLPEDGESKVICQFTSKLTLEQVSYFSRFLNDSAWL
jgi:hypothetical protein